MPTSKGCGSGEGAVPGRGKSTSKGWDERDPTTFSGIWKLWVWLERGRRSEANHGAGGVCRGPVHKGPWVANDTRHHEGVRKCRDPSGCHVDVVAQR